MENSSGFTIITSATTINSCNSLQRYSTPSFPSSSSPSPISCPLAPMVVLSPCAACKILRRRCADTCMLAPYFPPTDPVKFTTAHRVFGASNIIKLLQDIPESQRADAVNSMVYEADARLRDPVYGCAGSVCQLMKQASELKVQLARTQAELMNLQIQYTNLLKLFYMEMKQYNGGSQSLCVNGVNNGVLLRDDEVLENDLHGAIY